MPILGVTGGIAAGKSSFTKAISPALLADVYDADAAARRLLETNDAVKGSVRECFGDEVFGRDGAIDRPALRKIVFERPEARRTLEGILHPPIREEWTALAQANRERDEANRWLVVDIPLLFETEASPHFDGIAVVACTRATQVDRLRRGRGLSAEVALQMIGAQLDQELKMRLADFVAWNEGREEHLIAQARSLASFLNSHGTADLRRT